MEYISCGDLLSFVRKRSKLSEIGEIMTSIAHQWKTPLIEISTIAQ